MSIDLDFVYRPRSVALVGATDRPGRPGSVLLANLVGNGYSGAVYPVSHSAGLVAGRRAYRSVEHLPEVVDLAYLLLPAEASVDVAAECAATGVRSVIIGASGFAEASTEEGAARQRRLSELARSSGMRIVGPNCNGIYNVIDRVALGFNAAHSLDLRPGGLAILSHSGALFSTMMSRAQRLGLGLAYFASVGNEVDLTILDHLEYVLAQPATRVVALVVDSLPDGGRFAHLARSAARRGIRVLALKLGTTEAGAAVAVAHSSRLAGREDTYRALFTSLGIGVVDTVEQLMTAAALLDRPVPVLRGSRVGGLVMSGGAGAIIADSAARHDVPMAAFSEGTYASLTALATSAVPGNPVDTGFAAGRAGVGELLALVGDDENVDVVTTYYHPRVDPAGRAQLAAQLVNGQERTGIPHVMLAPADLTVEEHALYSGGGVLVVDDTEVCFAAYAAAAAAAPIEMDDQPAPRIPRGDIRPLGDRPSLDLLAEYGVEVVPLLEAVDCESAVEASIAVGFPVVVKGVAPGVAHKSDVALVAVGLRDPGAVRRAAHRMTAVVDLDGFIVQPMVLGAYEALVGLVTEPRVGQFVLVGSGGIHAEALRDTAVVPVGASNEAMRAALLSTQLGRVVTSSRWPFPHSVEQLVAAMAAVDRLAAQRSVFAVDVNPLVLTAGAAVAVDALVIPAAPTP